MSKQEEATNTINEHLGELKRILLLMDEQYGLVQTFDKYSYIKRLYQQVRKHIRQIEEALEESEQ